MRNGEDKLQHNLNKVPAVSLLFWITKLISTGLGESVSDFSNGIFGKQNLVMGAFFTISWSFVLFAVFLTLQIRSDRYRPLYYWMSVALLAVFGTFIVDAVRAVTGLSYMETTTLFTILMIISFVGWYVATNDLSVHRITTIKKEIFYWLTVASSFILGTATGDWFASKRATDFIKGGLGLGYLDAGLVFGGVFVAILAYRIVINPKLNSRSEITTFWLAYVLTRPVGASFADYFGYSFHNGVLGNKGMSAIWIILFVIGLMINIKRKNQEETLGLKTD
ncbi:COG4705 family protein [Pediococcus claussenii]|uniref:Membrane-anchored protein n=1 Tax=Pediococcus claussenii (strain ATCC BAA-344 / DSM 14800 / JCM 18046 / KCTC 3811 / LMG 21948 / P06) TaxID=701521 RepID=G8PAE9_PEDCP|nr:hypothetical protein [Pediococcus claussenii]AEV95738.1 hypothetical protein PECL_1517 [Pediococcus claussenii ATCC BAA-344]ANZ69247.1 hypothetical protein AYR57_02545 [Pediococcus claussenii]ANZ71066.1 hypothetical protein AYR58_02560 [Pediococcus claussenii]